MLKKSLAAVLAASVLAAALTGCGGGAQPAAPAAPAETPQAAAPEAPAPEQPATPEAPAQGEPVELIVWESDQGPDEFIRQAGEAFTAINPNITVKYVHVELGDTDTQIALDGPAGVGADLFVTPHDRLGKLVTSGHILAAPNPEAVTSTVLGACATAATYDGIVYAYPVSAETYALYYNKDLVPEADVPKTWEDMYTFCEAYNTGNKYGFVMDVGNAYYTILFTTSGNNLLFGPNGTDPSTTNINTPASVEGMKFFQSMRGALNVPAADLQTAQADEAFKAGNAAMHVTGPWNVNPFEEAGLNFGVTTLPALPGNSEPAASFSGTRVMAISAYSDYPAEAALFAEFLLTPEMQKLRYDLTGAIPAIEIPVDSPYIQGFSKQLDYAFPMPSIPEMNGFWPAMAAASANIWDGADVQAELDACDAAILAQ